MSAEERRHGLARGRMIAVLGVLLMGAIGLIASTQPWYFVELHEVSEHPLEVAVVGDQLRRGLLADAGDTR